MVIEFFGLPGVGKSTIARALEKFDFVRVRIQNKRELLMYNIVYFFLHPRAFVKMGKIIVVSSIRYGRFYRLFMNVFLDTNARIAKAKMMHQRAIIDQGHLQAFLSLSYHKVSQEEVFNFLKFLPKPNCVVVFTAPEEIRTAHLKERGYYPRENEPSSKAWLEHISENAETISSALLQDKKYPVRLVSTERPVEKVVEEIKTFVRI